MWLSRLSSGVPSNTIEYQRAYRQAHQEEEKRRAKTTYEKNRDKILASAKEKYRLHREERLAYQRQYDKKNAAVLRKKQTVYQRERHRSDPDFRLAHNLRRSLAHYIHGKRSTPAAKLLGCSWSEFRQSLESRFVEGMNWDNYGTYWHIDHEIPITRWNLSDPAQLAACWHHTNLRPLLAELNVREKARLEIDFSAEIERRANLFRGAM